MSTTVCEKVGYINVYRYGVYKLFFSVQKLSPSLLYQPGLLLTTSLLLLPAGIGLRINGMVAMGTPLVGYASFETDGENISGLAIQFINDNTSVVLPSE